MKNIQFLITAEPKNYSKRIYAINLDYVGSLEVHRLNVGPSMVKGEEVFRYDVMARWGKDYNNNISDCILLKRCKTPEEAEKFISQLLAKEK